MRTSLAIAVAVTCAALGGCAIVVNPGTDGDVQVRTPFSKDGVQGNGVLASDQRAVGTVQGLEVSGSIVVDVRVGPATSLLVEADSNILPLVRTDVRGDRLVVEVERSWRSSNPVRVTYTVPRLTDVRRGGSGRLSVQGLNGAPLTVSNSGSGTTVLAGRVASLDADSAGSGSLDATMLESASANLRLTGSGHMNVGQVRGDYAIVKLDGSGQLRVGGSVRALTARASGSGQLDLAHLASEQADLSSTGSGGITANVRQSLIAQNGGSGGIRVYGNPAQRSVSGNLVQLVN
ncbi:head GIN domain-containing protein [uncultured Massilia sp.]|uniref:head GIN domain-containing protein n=1 Tax=uncultured Massilia sp. TaxID=169973 RepID=UPI0025CC3C26|nr:head GIN domain-containing protein [uncultured Massilia sp.]